MKHTDPLTEKCIALKRQVALAKKVQKMYARQLDICLTVTMSDYPFATSAHGRLKKKVKELTSFITSSAALSMLCDGSHRDDAISTFMTDQIMSYALQEVDYRLMNKALKQACEESSLVLIDEDMYIVAVK